MKRFKIIFQLQGKRKKNSRIIMAFDIKEAWALYLEYWKEKDSVFIAVHVFSDTLEKYVPTNFIPPAAEPPKPEVPEPRHVHYSAWELL